MQPDQYAVPPHEGAPHFGQNPRQMTASQMQESQSSFKQYRTSLTPPSNPLMTSAASGQSSGAQYTGSYSAYEATSSAGTAGGAQYPSYSGNSPQPGTVPGGSTYFSGQSTGVPASTTASVANYSNQASVTQSQGPVQHTTTTYQTQVVGQRQEGVAAYTSPVHEQSVTTQEVSYQQGLATGGSNSRYMSAAQGTYSASQYTTQRLASGATETSRVIGVEYGPQRIVSVQQHVDHYQVVGEHEVVREITVPKKIIREETFHHVIIRPETIVKEEIIQETQKVKEKIREVARPIIEEKIIEVPEYEIVEKIVEVPQIEYKEKIREEVQVQRQERIVEVPVVVPQERIVEIPEVQYREVPVEKVVEVPELREEVVVRQVPVPQYVDKPVPQYVEVEVPNIIDRNIPVPVEAVVAYEFRIPRLKGHYTKVTYPVYLPRFVETPIAAELYNASITQKAEHYLQQISSLTRTAASLCEIENLAFAIMQADLYSQCQQVDIQAAVLQAWNSGLQITGGTSTGMITTGAGLSHGAYSSGQQGYGAHTILGAQQSGATGTITTTTTTTTTNASPSHHHQSRSQRHNVHQSSNSPVAHH